MTDSPKTNGSEATRFREGNPGGPGRPKGSKHKLAESFLKALAEDFEAHGSVVIAEVRDKDPATYMRVVASVLPKESQLNVEHSGAVEHRGLPEISSRITELLTGRAVSDSAPLLPH